MHLADSPRLIKIPRERELTRWRKCGTETFGCLSHSATLRNAYFRRRGDSGDGKNYREPAKLAEYGRRHSVHRPARRANALRSGTGSN